MEIVDRRDKNDLLDGLWEQESRQGSRKPFGMDAGSVRKPSGSERERRDRRSISQSNQVDKNNE